MKKKCYLYLRVSTDIQVDGYSLEAQQRRLEEFAEYKEMEVSGIYCDAGRSGKSIKGRPEFQRMLDDISSQKDGIEAVLVFKLSRFGRNAADVLKSIQFLDDYDIYLVSVEEGIDSSTQGGRLMLSLLSAVAEIERVNIRDQFMAGKRQSVRDGGWGGGPIPYGYRKAKDGLVQEKTEAELIGRIYEEFLKPEQTYSGVVMLLNNEGYKRRKGKTKIPLSFDFVKRVLASPFYCGKLTYGKDNVDEDKRIMTIGKHKPIVTEEMWEKARLKREGILKKAKSVPQEEHINVLSGLVKCPLCGRPMVGNKDTKVNRNHGGMYKPMYYYVCNYHGRQHGNLCSYSGHINQEKLDATVFEMVSELMLSNDFKEMLMKRYGNGSDEEDIQSRIEELKQRLHDLRMKQRNLGDTLDSLDVFADDYDERYEAIQSKIDEIYDDAESVEKRLIKLKSCEEQDKENQMSMAQIRKLLKDFTSLYERMDDREKKECYRRFISRIDILPDQKGGRLIKEITYNFPVMDGERITYTVDCTKMRKTVAESKATYAQIKAFILERHEARVSTLNIAQIKRKYGLKLGKAYNKPEENKNRVPNCTKEKEGYILEAFKHFRMVAEKTEMMTSEGEENE